MNPDTIKGSCHCGAITFSARIDFAQPTIRCNCSICTKARAWISLIPAERFELRSGAGIINEYRFGAKTITHCFCSRCGVKTHGRLHGDDGKDTWVAVYIATLDLAPARLAAMTVSYIDGRNDRFEETPELVAYL